MQVSLETKPGLERILTIEIEADVIEKAVENKLREIGKTAKMDGFRPGKVPFKVLSQRYYGAARHEVVSEQIEKSFREAMVQEKLNPAGMPDVKPMTMGKGENLKYTATFEVYPEIDLTEEKEIQVEKQEAAVTDKDVDSMLEKLREQNKEWVDVELAAKNGDQVTMDFVGSIDGEEFKGGKAAGHELELGSNKFIPGFEDQLVGIKAGEEKTITVSFPKEYGSEELAGKDAQFAITCHKVSEPQLPGLDDAFAEKLGIEGGFDGLKKEVRENMERQLDEALKNQLKNSVLDGFMAAHPVDVPKAMVDSEIKRLGQQAMQQFKGSQDLKDLPELPGDLFKEEATKSATLGLLLSEVIKKHNIKPTNDQLKAAIERIAANYEDTDSVVKWYFQDKNRLGQIEAMVLEELVVEKILETAKVKTVTVDYDTALNPKANEEMADAASTEEKEIS